MTTTINPRVKNWKDLTEQFGTHTPIGENYKTAYEIYADLILANKRLNTEVDTMILIACEKGNFDSADCIFSYTGMIGEQRAYEYTGTAK